MKTLASPVDRNCVRLIDMYSITPEISHHAKIQLPSSNVNLHTHSRPF